MTPETFVDILREALWLIIVLVSIMVVPSLIVGLIVAIFQAATSINEQTLSFLPRLIVTLLALMVAGHWITAMLMDHFYNLVERIPSIIG
ncbi:flagellar biosynthesis protein FliQ [Psychrosphaera ytuae]|uniref:Flagellar biosynthetic protein FliQ n=1 Tax=Psychrosphaera ytuae TaxID=2820710 RepID=A0A975DBF3_9GAMM|nr:flagellar biosynthesis protein FliQ [Psychrosphaera ytuae]QTH63773.1 flagellar biosynthesis protein FliQ [Psychrosphaera ytuae]